MKEAAKPIHRIYLPGHERSVTLGAYVKIVKHAIAYPEASQKHGLLRWYPTDGKTIREEFRQAVDQRINENVGYSQRGKGFSAKRIGPKL